MKYIPHIAAESKGARGIGLRVALLIKFTSGRYCYTSDGWDPQIPNCVNRQRVLSWGEVGTLLEASDPSAFSQARFGVNIGDPDGELRDMFEDEQFQGRDCSLYWAVFTPGEAPPTYQDSVKILRGTVVSPTQWAEGDRSVSLAVTDLSEYNEVIVGARANRDEFPWIDDDQEGRVIPTVYGYVDRVSPVLLNRGPSTRMARFITENATSLVVTDAEKFTQGAEISIEVGNEIITGTFDGNLFTVSSRGVNLFSSTTTGASTGSCTLIDNTLPAETWPDNRFVGYELKITIATSPGPTFTYGYSFECIMQSMLPTFLMTWGADEVRRVIRIIKSQHKVEWNKPYVIEQSILDDGAGNWVIEGEQLNVGAGVAYIIGTVPQTHQAGDDVLRYLGNTVSLQYAVAMGECTVRQVYVHGHLYKPRTLYLGHLTSYVGTMSSLTEAAIHQMNAERTESKDDWIPLRPDLYTVDTSTAEGKTFTRVNLVRYPTQLTDYICTTDDILIDVTGPTNDSDDVIVNPAEVIEHLYATYADVASKRGLEAWWKFDELSGTVAKDSSGHTHDGNLVGDPTWLPAGGEIDGAIDLDGIDDEVVVPNDARLQAACAGVLSVAFWAKLDDLGVNSSIMTKLPAGFQINVDVPTNALRLYSSSGPDFAIGTISITDNDWHHYAVVINNTAVSMYVDGVALVMTDSVITTVPGNTNPLRIGRATLGDGYLNGALDDVRIYDRLLNAAEIAALAAPAVASFDCTNAQEKLVSWKMNFGREILSPLRDIVSDLAMQGRSRIRWIGDDPEMLYLGVDGGDVDLEIASRNILQNSATVGRDERDLGASRVTVSWDEDGEQRSLTEIDVDAEAEIGEREYRVDCWAYDTIEEPRSLARFFLQTMKKLHDRAAMAVTLHGVGLEPGDIVQLNPSQQTNAITEFDANLLWYAGDFDVVEGWTPTNLTVIPNATSPPDNIDSAYKLVEPDGLVMHNIVQGALTVTPGKYYRWACRVKAAERDEVYLTLPAVGMAASTFAYFNLSTGVITPGVGATDYGMSALNDGWYLCWIEGLCNVGTAAQPAGILTVKDGTAGLYLGVAGNGIYIAGAQFYSGRTIDEYMPTWKRNGVRTNVSLSMANLTRNAHLGDKLIIGDDEYLITENGVGFIRVAGDVDGDGHVIGDNVILTNPTAYDPFVFAPTKARVVEVVHSPGAEPDVLAREDINLRLFRWADCDMSCEGSCETTGCETSCESYYEPSGECWTCETSCQTACEHFCETGGELFCSDHACETSLVVGCEIVCQVAVMAVGVPCGFCQTSCQSTCEVDTCQTSSTENP